MKTRTLIHFKDSPLMGKINIVIGGLTLALTVLITAISIFYYSFILSDRLYGAHQTGRQKRGRDPQFQL